MELIAEKLTLDNIDKSNWKMYRFDQIARNISERVEPTQTNLEIYVGLDHIDSDSIHIKRFGKREDVSGTKLRCYPGDVIFGRRRAYQRKAAIVTFDGFCSAHSLVLRANPDVIIPELFPFFLHSDTFMHLAVDISVGSLSPTINWGDLKKQEFLLPPKDQQQQIAELLWAGDEMIEGEQAVQKKLKVLLNAHIHKFFNNTVYEYVKLDEVAEIRYGLTLNANRVKMPIQTPYLRVANVSRGKISLDEVKEVGCTKNELNNYQLSKKDLLVVEGHADIREIGRAAIWNEEELMLHQNHLIRVRCNDDKVLPEMVESYINSAFGQVYFQANSKSTSGLNTINSSVVKNCKVPLINLILQNDFVRKKNLLERQIKELARQALNSKALQKALINQFF